MPVIVNAVVTKAFVGFHGRENVALGLVVYCKTPNGEGMMEGHYNIVLDEHCKNRECYTPLGDVILAWLRASGAKDVGGMVGRYVRLELPDPGSAVPNRVGHIVDEGLWFSTAAIMEDWGARLIAARRNADAMTKAPEGDGQ